MSLVRYVHTDKTRAGKFRKSPPCDACGKPVGTAYFTDDEVCGNSDGPGFYLCERKRCTSRLKHLGVDERRRIYTEQRNAGVIP